jgi:hypothetical protein
MIYTAFSIALPVTASEAPPCCARAHACRRIVIVMRRSACASRMAPRRAATATSTRPGRVCAALVGAGRTAPTQRLKPPTASTRSRRAYAAAGRSVSPANFGMDDIIAQLGSLTGELADAPAEQLQLIADVIGGCYASGQLQVQCAEHCTSRTPRTGVRVQDSRTELHVQAGEEWTPPVGSTHRARALLSWDAGHGARQHGCYAPSVPGPVCAPRPPRTTPRVGLHQGPD